MKRLTQADTCIAVVLLAYALGFAIFAPRALLIVDESRYVAQAVAFSGGRTTLPNARVVVPDESGLPSDYPPGTSLLQTPFVAIGGWRMAAIASVLSLVAATLLTARWLTVGGLRPEFALLLPAYVGSLFFGRVAMSDMPTTAVVALALLLLWRAEQSGTVAAAVLAGLAAGAVLLFREPPILLVAPFVAGAVARNTKLAIPLLAGGVVAAIARMSASWLLFGSPWYLRDPGYGFSLASVSHNALPYGVILLLLLPGSLALPFVYRGPHRAEFVTALGSYLALLLFFDWDSLHQNGLVKGIVLDTRYMLPAVPALSFMAAHVLGRAVPRRVIMTAISVSLAIAAFAIHPLIRRMEEQHAVLAHLLQETSSADTPVITNHDATFKYFSPALGDRRLILRDHITSDSVPALLARFGALSVTFLDRGDSEAFRQDAALNQAFLTRLVARGDTCRLTTRLDTNVGTSIRLRVFDIPACR